jgi:hypothetical protein
MAYADLRAFLHMLDGEAYGWSWVTTNHRFSVPIEPHGYQRLSMIRVQHRSSRSRAAGESRMRRPWPITVGGGDVPTMRRRPVCADGQ